MKWMKVMISIMLVTMLMGCATLSLRQNVETEYDSFSGVTTYLGVESNNTEYPDESLFATASARYFLRTFVEDKKVIHQLYVKSMYTGSDWPFFYRAIAEDKSELEFTKIGSDVSVISTSSMIYTEIFGLNISDEILERQSQGFKIKVYGKSGVEIILFIDEIMITNQIEAIRGI